MRWRPDPTERRIIGLALPALGTLAIEPLYLLSDSAIVGRLGTAQLAALGISATVIMVALCFTDVLEIGITPDVAFAHGQGDAVEARQVATNALWLAVGLGGLIGIVIAAGARPLGWLLGGRGDVLEHTVTYLRWSAVGIPFLLVTVVGHAVMRGVNQLRLPLVIVACSNAVNVVLEIVFVLGLRWGMAGSAGSTVIAQVLGAGAFLIVLRPHRSGQRPMYARIAPLLRRGVHYSIRSLAMTAVWVITTIAAARIDTATLAANQVLTQLFMLLALVLDSLAIPAQSLVAGALGAHDEHDAIRVGNACTRVSLLVAAVLGGALALASPWLPLLFSDDAAVHDRLTAGLLVLAVMQLPGAIAFALDGALIGAHDERFLGRQAMINLACFIPLGLAAWAFPSLGLAGLWGAQLAWMTLRAWVNRRRWQLRPWRLNAPALG